MPQDWTNKRGQGQAIKWLRDNLGHEGEGCLIWPFFRDADNGYGRLGFEGKLHWAHRLMCELVNGPPPSDDYEASHSCGRGHEGCAHPKHLSWKTRTANQLDRRKHGTKSLSGWRWEPKLTPVDVVQIRKYDGPLTQRALAAIYEVTDATIRDIKSGKSWKKIPFPVA